ncbi:MAG: hypothetical protein JKY37_34935 [Nannocystaceae bacterium]|nr:hypothetical protein [Nannocystaceae bacterium]
MARTLTIKLEPLAGTIERFYAFVECSKRIADDGTSARTWSGEIADSASTIKLRVFGVGSAKYKFTLDLPGTAADQSLELSLDQGYGELELTI